MSDASAPQPGWYADPENPAGERWWNGSGWSDHKRDSTEARCRSSRDVHRRPVGPDARIPRPGIPRPLEYIPPASVASRIRPARSRSCSACTGRRLGRLHVRHPRNRHRRPSARPLRPAGPGLRAAVLLVAVRRRPLRRSGLRFGHQRTRARRAHRLGDGGLVVHSRDRPDRRHHPLRVRPSAGAGQREAAGNPNSGRGLAMAGSDRRHRHRGLHRAWHHARDHRVDRRATPQPTGDTYRRP